MVRSRMLEQQRGGDVKGRRRVAVEQIKTSRNDELGGLEKSN